MKIPDPHCAMHGKKRSEHTCLYCCICFKDLTIEECHITKDGEREDVCNDCAKHERDMLLKEQIERNYYNRDIE